MTAENGNDGGLPAVGPLTGEEREQSERLTKSRDDLRAEYARVDKEMREKGCRLTGTHTHYSYADGTTSYDYATEATIRDRMAAGNYYSKAPVGIVPCIGPRYPLAELADQVGSYTKGTLRLDKDGLWLWVPIKGCDARMQPISDEHPVVVLSVGHSEGCNDPEDHWQDAANVSIRRLREYAPIVGPFLEQARDTLISRAMKEAGENEIASEAVRRMQGKQA